MSEQQEIISMLSSRNIKITPQRIAVYEIVSMLDHPYADEIMDQLKINNPSIAKGTVYSILDFFCNQGILHKVKTANGKMRYDPIDTQHHHIVEKGSDKIEDYSNEELNLMLQNYFANNPIPGYEVEEIRLQLQVIRSTNT